MRTDLACALFVALLCSACPSTVEKVDPRTGCLVCHMPRPAPGADPEGIEAAHPYGEISLSCTDCHGGDPTSYEQTKAHVASTDGVTFLRNLTAGQLDRIDPNYLRFINPGDLRVANTTCGGGSPASGGSGCHQTVVDKVRKSMMGHTAGEVIVARYRAGLQDDPLAHLGATALFDEDYDANLPSTVEQMERFEPPEPNLAILDTLSSTTSASSTAARDLYGQIQDDYMVKSCFRCHLWDFGENRFRGDFRSSGCTACHMVYSDEGTSQSKDPRIPKDVSPHPIQHVLTTKIPTDQCMHCHYRGGRIGPNFKGYRESGGPGFNPENPDTVGVAQHGHDAAFYITDEDTTNQEDETPPDIHFEKGLHCIDCHRSFDVHGDGHIYSDTQVPVAIECEDCHGTIDEETNFVDSRGTLIEGLERDADGVWLTSRMTGERHKVTQIKQSVDPNSPLYRPVADQTMGRDKNGFTHTDNLECYACHSAWYPSCYGCHVTMDYSKTGRILTTGETRAGKPSGARFWVETDDLVLMWNTEGKIAPSMPSERFLLTVKNGDGDEVVSQRARRKRGTGALAFGQRTFAPHTVRRNAPFSICARCHIRADGSNREMVEQTVGLGTDRYIVSDDLGTTYRLDAIVDPDTGESLVDVAHPEPDESRPLEPALRNKLLTEPVE